MPREANLTHETVAQTVIIIEDNAKQLMFKLGLVSFIDKDKIINALYQFMLEYNKIILEEKEDSDAISS